MPGVTQAPPGHRGRPMSAEREALYTRFIDEIVTTGRAYQLIGDDLELSRATAWSWWDRALKAGLVTKDTPGAPKEKLSKDVQRRRKELLYGKILGGATVATAAKELRIATGTAERWLAEMGVRVKDLRDVGGTGPIAWDQLSAKARAALEPSGFPSFREKVLGRTWNPPWAGICARQLLEDYMSPDDEYDVLNAPPGVGKSTLLTHDFAVWVATRERALGGEPTILLGHRSWQKSTWYVKRVRATFSTNETLIRWYGRFKADDPLARWSVEELEIELLQGVRRLEKEPTFAAGSYDASLLSGRFKLVIWDDLIDKTNSSTVEQRTKLEDWNDNEAESRLEPGGLYVLSNARYGPEDLSFAVTQATDAEDIDDATGEARPFYKRIRFRAHDETKCNGEVHDGPWPDGCLLDPERVTWKRLRRQIAKNEGRYLLVWQQEDTDPAGNLAHRAWFEGGTDETGARVAGCFDHDRRFGQLLYPLSSGKVPILSAVTLDPSSSKYWAMAHYLGYKDREHVVHRALRRPLQAPDILYIDEANPGGYVGLLEEWWQASAAEGVPFRYFVMEINAAQKWAMQYPFFMRWANSREVAIIPHTTTKNKTDVERGVEMLRPVYQFAKVHIPYGGYEEKLLADAWRREACAYPEGQTSDLIMAHWFYVNRMDALGAAEVFDAAEPDMTGIPEWAHIQPPSWAGAPEKSLDRGTTLVRG